MDKSFGTLFGAPPKNTPISRSRQSLGGSLFSTGGGGIGARKGGAGGPPLAGSMSRKGSGRYSLSTRSNMSTLQVVAKSDYNVLECYGLPLPVQVNEILTFAERSAPVSIGYGQNGWAWLVHGRRLLIWQYRESHSKAAMVGGGGDFPTPRRALASQCRQLTLPHCDIGHKATLISVFIAEGHQMASCLAVSPAGDVRYWPSIAHDGSSIDECNILEGQEFEEVIGLSSGNYLLVTTTCSLVQLQIPAQAGRQSIVARLVKPPSGFFGGIGKKFASIIIGMHSIQERENKLIKIASEKVSAHEWHITVLADKYIQRWAFSPSGAGERFLCEDAEIMRKIRDFFVQKLWARDAGSSEIELWPLDMRSTDRGVVILAAACNLQRTPQVFYALLTFVFEGDGMVLKESTMMKYKGFYSREREEETIGFRFVANRAVAYVYSDKVIYPVNLDRGVGSSAANSESSSPSEELEKIEFNVQDDAILAANCFQNTALFFSKIHGLVVVTPSDFEPNSEVFNSSVSSDVFNPNISVNDSAFISQSIFAPATTNAGNLVLYDLDPEEISNADRDPVNQLKAAFIYHIKRNIPASNEIINEILQAAEQKPLDGTVDQIVLQIARDLAEDIPAADPRWEVTQKHALGSSTSMQIVQQLREKNIALTQFIEFLHASTLWDKLGASSGDVVRPTAHLLADIAEKIVAAIALKCLHASHARIIDEAIDLVLREGNRSPPSPNLTNQDLFYVQVNQIHEIFKVFADLVESYIRQEFTTTQVQTALVEINTITVTVLQEVTKFREAKTELFTIRDDLNRYECVPWTASSGKYGMKDVLLHMINSTLKYGIKGSGEPEFKIKHYKQMTELVDFVLDGRKRYLDSVQDEAKRAVLLQQYESQRSDLIFPLVDAEQYELAAKLAEKYLDFQILVVICDKTNSQSRLDEYIERYKELDFSQFAISWHMRQNKQGDIFQRFKQNQSELARFLSDHPSLAWIQLVFNGELAQAAEVLLTLAQNEKELLSRKRVMLSLSKLCALAAEGNFSAQIAEINSESKLLDLQEEIPTEILNIYGYDTKNAKVLSPEEIVDLYIADEYTKSSESEFRKALELLDFVEEPMEVRHKIWCAAILRDSWNNYNPNAPLDTMQGMMFFRLIDLCYILDGELENFLPAVENFLAAPELGELVESKSFQYLIKLGYEHIYDSYKKK